MRYAVVIERAQNNYSAYVPDLPGCVATGATVEEVEREIREAIRFHLEGLRQDGLPISPAIDGLRVCRRMSRHIAYPIDKRPAEDSARALLAPRGRTLQAA